MWLDVTGAGAAYELLNDIATKKMEVPKWDLPYEELATCLPFYPWFVQGWLY